MTSVSSNTTSSSIARAKASSLTGSGSVVETSLPSPCGFSGRGVPPAAHARLLSGAERRCGSCQEDGPQKHIDARACFRRFNLRHRYPAPSANPAPRVRGCGIFRHIAIRSAGFSVSALRNRDVFRCPALRSYPVFSRPILGDSIVSCARPSVTVTASGASPAVAFFFDASPVGWSR